jgi:hypothetical protein
MIAVMRDSNGNSIRDKDARSDMFPNLLAG